eukprot:2291127-Rhodomonas_salina.1
MPSISHRRSHEQAPTRRTPKSRHVKLCVSWRRHLQGSCARLYCGGSGGGDGGRSGGGSGGGRPLSQVELLAQSLHFGQQLRIPLVDLLHSTLQRTPIVKPSFFATQKALKRPSRMTPDTNTKSAPCSMIIAIPPKPLFGPRLRRGSALLRSCRLLLRLGQRSVLAALPALLLLLVRELPSAAPQPPQGAPCSSRSPPSTLSAHQTQKHITTPHQLRKIISSLTLPSLLPALPLAHLEGSGLILKLLDLLLCILQACRSTAVSDLLSVQLQLVLLQPVSLPVSVPVHLRRLPPQPLDLQPQQVSLMLELRHLPPQIHPAVHHLHFPLPARACCIIVCLGCCVWLLWMGVVLVSSEIASGERS